jgi:MFS family permease
VTTWLTRILPANPLTRRLSLQAILFAVGEGVFITGNAVFFTRLVGLSAAQVGLGLSIAGLFTFALAVPMGRLADRLGPKRIWWVSAAGISALYLTYPLIHGFAAFTVLVCALAAVDAAGSAGRGAYTIDIFSREERVRSQAYMRSALNIGFTIGAFLGGLALAAGSDSVIRALQVLTAAVLALNAALITRLPDVRHAHVAPASDHVTPTALRNRGFLVLSLCNGVLATNQVLLNIVVPLWLVQRTDAPQTVLAWLFATNTVLAVAFQVPAARGSDTVPGALRATRLCAAAFVISCAIIAYTHDTRGWASIALLLLGHVTITAAELFESASSWGFLAELSDPSRRGEYQGVWRLGFQVEAIVGPAAFTFLAITWGPPGWAVIATLAVVASAVAHPAARAAQRHLQAHGLPEPVRSDDPAPA